MLLFKFIQINGTTEKKWTGMMGEMVEGRADMIVAPLPINHEGAKVIDFSKPYKYRGISMIIKKVSMIILTHIE